MQFVGGPIEEQMERARRFWSRKNPMLEAHFWQEAEALALFEIEKNIENMSEEDKKVQRKLQMELWLKENPKPLYIDQVERLAKKLGMRPFSAEEDKESLKFFADKDKLSAAMKKYNFDDYVKKNKEKLDKIAEIYGLVDANSDDSDLDDGEPESDADEMAE